MAYIPCRHNHIVLAIHPAHPAESSPSSEQNQGRNFSCPIPVASSSGTILQTLFCVLFYVALPRPLLATRSLPRMLREDRTTEHDTDMTLDSVGKTAEHHSPCCCYSCVWRQRLLLLLLNKDADSSYIR